MRFFSVFVVAAAIIAAMWVQVSEARSPVPPQFDHPLTGMVLPFLNNGKIY